MSKNPNSNLGSQYGVFNHFKSSAKKLALTAALALGITEGVTEKIQSVIQGDNEITEMERQEQALREAAADQRQANILNDRTETIERLRNYNFSLENTLQEMTNATQEQINDPSFRQRMVETGRNVLGGAAEFGLARFENQIQYVDNSIDSFEQYVKDFLELVVYIKAQIALTYNDIVSVAADVQGWRIRAIDSLDRGHFAYNMIAFINLLLTYLMLIRLMKLKNMIVPAMSNSELQTAGKNTAQQVDKHDKAIKNLQDRMNRFSAGDTAVVAEVSDEVQSIMAQLGSMTPEQLSLVQGALNAVQQIDQPHEIEQAK